MVVVLAVIEVAVELVVVAVVVITKMAAAVVNSPFTRTVFLVLFFM